MARLIDYVAALQGLLPSGAAWTQDGDSNLSNFLAGIAEEFFQVDKRVGDLLREADPRLASASLKDWERICGLPDLCVGKELTIAERRLAVVARLIQRGGQTKAFMIEVARVLGFEITITEFTPLWAGFAAGDPVSNGDWRYSIRVNAPETTVRRFHAGSAAGEPIATWGNESLECALNRIKPAHTKIHFAYG